MHIQLWRDNDDELLDDIEDINKPKTEIERQMLINRIIEMIDRMPDTK